MSGVRGGAAAIAAAALLTLGMGGAASAAVNVAPVYTGGERPLTAAFPRPGASVVFGGVGLQRPSGTIGSVLHHVGGLDLQTVGAAPLLRDVTDARILGNGMVWIVHPPRVGAVRSWIDRDDAAQTVPADASITSAPDRLASDATDALWMAGTARGKVTRIAHDGRVREWALPVSGRPDDAAVETAADGRVWIARGRALRAYTRRGPAAALRLPFAVRSMVTGPDGALWAVSRAGRIVRIAMSGATRVLPARVPGGRFPEIASGPHGHLWLTVPATGRLLELAPSGETTVHRVGRTPASTGLAVTPGSFLSGESWDDTLQVATRALWVRTSWGIATVVAGGACRAPDLTGRTLDEARAVAAAAGCSIAPAHHVPAVGELVTDQSPRTGEKLGARRAITLTFGPPPGPGPCRPPFEYERVAETDDVVVWQSIRDRSAYVCPRAGGRITQLPAGRTGTGISDLLQAGDILAYRYGDAGGSSGSRVSELGVADLSGRWPWRGTRLGSTLSGGPSFTAQPGAIHDLVLDADGTVAWIGHEERYGYQEPPPGGLPDALLVFVPGETTPRVVATAAPGSLAALRLDGDAVRWTESGEPRSAPRP